MRMDKDVHKRLAFRYACFESGKHVCEFEHCGTDIWLYKTDVQIPTSYPDGDYVLSWAWFGGLSVSKSYFGDYYSCTFVRISGGELTANYTPVFRPGGDTVYEHTCRSSVDRVGICEYEPCLGRPEMQMKPFPFMEQGGPAPITLSWFAKNVAGFNGSAATAGQESSLDNTTGLNNTMSQSPLPVPSHSLAPSPSPVVNVTEAPVKVVGLKMINTDNSEVMAQEFSGPIRVRADMTNFTFVATTEGPVSSVKFFLNNKYIRTERVEPFSCWGDTSRNFNAWPQPIFGEAFKIRVDAFSRQTGKSRRRHFKVFSIELRRASMPST